MRAPVAPSSKPQPPVTSATLFQPTSRRSKPQGPGDEDHDHLPESLEHGGFCGGTPGTPKNRFSSLSFFSRAMVATCCCSISIQYTDTPFFLIQGSLLARPWRGLASHSFL